MRQDYDAYAPRYDRETSIYERAMLGGGRAWACSQARGEVLEVAIGTGRNLPFYPQVSRVTGVELSPAMLTRARARAGELGRQVQLVEGDAQALPFRDAAFDTVVCTLGLSSIPDDRVAVAEMHRVLRRGGHVVLLGHVASPHLPLRGLQLLLERFPAAVGTRRPADRQTRQVVPLLRAAGFTVLYRGHTRGGIVERVTATR
ncbi:ubiquinone/menaquinone biosynthesis C-methylase UbiE [Prauserella isguenensis]|uniref:Ubiquinone/menaquinone biosynthesis C-methylase UbiE n=1 Tax=Prauserella isguenensis TaxID=1470180 RepID=A0A839S513_9PSEU|nr:class I SAM-dependent methyltransferase [Prauserella isguenensis]MBB3052383.1 ubiquinone/menaquinone biosynthesis C-methylase UbiE [Prauserella isguenensis]